ncbi:hypothetical protein Ciccas_001331 [Cichlidogyrus casuarinus]|uniref:Cysteine/serine-rich nuclear protein N-terminal domain-containing protein n=1 Tax=Cichlidogyrus casuarinus TaxID=1844966 RepID=A0ABD2QKH0_9PLAT
MSGDDLQETTAAFSSVYADEVINSIAFSSPAVNNVDSKEVTKNVQFSNVIIYQFERCQGFDSVPDRGGFSLGMSRHHFAVDSYPVRAFSKLKRLSKPNNPFISSTISPIHSPNNSLTVCMLGLAQKHNYEKFLKRPKLRPTLELFQILQF